MLGYRRDVLTYQYTHADVSQGHVEMLSGQVEMSSRQVEMSSGQVEMSSGFAPVLACEVSRGPLPSNHSSRKAEKDGQCSRHRQGVFKPFDSLGLTSMR